MSTFGLDSSIFSVDSTSSSSGSPAGLLYLFVVFSSIYYFYKYWKSRPITFRAWFDKLKTYERGIIAFDLLIFIVPFGIIAAYFYFRRKSTGSQIDSIQHAKLLEDSKRRIVLKPNERIIFHDFSELHEERAVQNFGSSGSSVRLTKGVWIRASSGQSKSHGELTKIDDGTVTITQSRIVFSGQFKTYSYELKKISRIDSFTNGVAIGVEGRQKTLTFKTEKPFLMYYCLQVQANSTTSMDSNDAMRVMYEFVSKCKPHLEALGGKHNFEKADIDNLVSVLDTAISALTAYFEEYSFFFEKSVKLSKNIKEIISKLELILTRCKVIQKEYNKFEESSTEPLTTEVSKKILEKHGEKYFSEPFAELTTLFNEYLGSAKVTRASEK